MNGMTQVAAALALMIPAPLALSTPAQAAPSYAVEVCKRFLAEGIDPGLKLGECVSVITLGENLDDKGVAGNAYGLRLCRYLRDFYPENFSEFESLEDCAAYFASE
jgi:hypothetical protein